MFSRKKSIPIIRPQLFKFSLKHATVIFTEIINFDFVISKYQYWTELVCIGHSSYI